MISHSHLPSPRGLGLALIIAIAASGCGKGDSDSDGKGGSGSKVTKGGKLAVKFKNAKSTALSLAGESVAANDAAGLESLAYVLNNIELFREGSLKAEGSGFQVTAPGWSLLRNDAGLDYDDFDAEAARSQRDKFTDFLDAEQVGRLTQNVAYDSMHVGKYTTASIGWFRPFHVKCKVELADGMILHTKKVESFLKTGTGLDTLVKTLVNDMGTGPAEETVAMLPNGGTYSTFGKPFEITTEDVAKQSEFKLVLAYRPEGICQGASQNSQTNGIKWANHPDASKSDKLDTVPTIQVKFLDVIPIVARKGQQVLRDSYRLIPKSAVDADGNDLLDSLDAGSAYASTQRNLMDVYRVDADDVRGINFTAITPDDRKGVGLFAPARPNTVSQEGGAISGKDWMGNRVVDAFTPPTAVGDKAELVHNTCFKPAADWKTCEKTAKIIFEAELVEQSVIDAK